MRIIRWRHCGLQQTVFPCALPIFPFFTNSCHKRKNIGDPPVQGKPVIHYLCVDSSLDILIIGAEIRRQAGNKPGGHGQARTIILGRCACRTRQRTVNCGQGRGILIFRSPDGEIEVGIKIGIKSSGGIQPRRVGGGQQVLILIPLRFGETKVHIHTGNGRRTQPQGIGPAHGLRQAVYRFHVLADPKSRGKIFPRGPTHLADLILPTIINQRRIIAEFTGQVIRHAQGRGEPVSDIQVADVAQCFVSSGDKRFGGKDLIIRLYFTKIHPHERAAGNDQLKPAAGDVVHRYLEAFFHGVIKKRDVLPDTLIIRTI